MGRIRKSPTTMVAGLLFLERTTGHPRVRFANSHRLRSPVGALASSLQALRACLTLAPSRVRAHGMGTKKPDYHGSRAAVLGADNGARTRDPNLGKVVLYQLSHVRICKKNENGRRSARIVPGGEARIRTGGKGFAGLCLTTWPLRRNERPPKRPFKCNGADNGARTRDPNLGKVVLYQLSHVRLRVNNLRESVTARKYFFQKI